MRFTLVLQPNGKALLVTPDDITPSQVAQLRDVWNAWKTSNQDVLFVSNTDVRLVEDIELDLKEREVTDQKDMNEKSDMQDTAEQAQEDTEQNQRDQMTPNARDEAAEAGEAKQESKQMARKSAKDLVDTPETPRGNESTEIASREVDGGTPELAHHSDAISAGIYDPYKDQAPKSMTGDAVPEKKG